MKSKLFFWRKKKGITQQKLCFLLEISNGTASRWENMPDDELPQYISLLVDAWEKNERLEKRIEELKKEELCIA